MRPDERNALLSEVGRTLQDFAVERFDRYGPRDVRGAAFWDAAAYVVEQMGDGDWRREVRYVPAADFQRLLNEEGDAHLG